MLFLCWTRRNFSVPREWQGEIPSVGAVLLLDSEGNRIVARYFTRDFGNVAHQLAFEKKLFDKTIRTNAKPEVEIIILDGIVSVFRNSCDVWLYMVGTQAENELILCSALHALHESLASALRASVDKRLLLDNFDTLLLIIDELVDAGKILETDADAITARVVLKAGDGAGATAESFAEGGLNTMFSAARDQLARTLLK